MDRGVPRDADRPDVHSIGSGDAHCRLGSVGQLHVERPVGHQALGGEAFTYLSSGVLNVDRLDVEYAGGGGTVWTRPRRDQDCWNVALDVARRSLDRSRRQDDDVMLCLDQGRARLLTSRGERPCL